MSRPRRGVSVPALSVTLATNIYLAKRKVLILTGPTDARAGARQQDQEVKLKTATGGRLYDTLVEEFRYD